MIDMDLILVVIALLIAWVAQTKASAITAAEFMASIGTMSFMMTIGVNTPFMWLVFAGYAWGATYFHVKCTSNPAIFTGFALAMLYYLGMFYDWGLVFWSGYEPGIFENSYWFVMPILAIYQLASTLVFGGFTDGLNRWRNNFNDRRNPYLCTIQGSPK